jgi:hypothetical protein
VKQKLTQLNNINSQYQYSSSYLTSLLLLISLFIEVRKQEVEHHCMKTNPPDKRYWIVAVNEEQLEGVNHHKDELNLQNVQSCIRLIYCKSLNVFIYLWY